MAREGFHCDLLTVVKGLSVIVDQLNAQLNGMISSTAAAHVGGNLLPFIFESLCGHRTFL